MIISFTKNQNIWQNYIFLEVRKKFIHTVSLFYVIKVKYVRFMSQSQKMFSVGSWSE